MLDALDKLIMLSMPHSPLAERFRTLRTKLLRLVEGGKTKLLFASPWPSDGKSIICANLGVALAQVGKRVIMVDLDLRRATLGRLFGLHESEGLADVLERGLPLTKALRATSVPNLTFLPPGSLSVSPADMISGGRMDVFLRELSRQADCVLFDSPSLSMFAEGLALSSHMDGVILIINSRRWSGDTELELKKNLEAAGAHILGIVINEVVEEPSHPYGAYGYGAYGAYGAYDDYYHRQNETGSGERPREDSSFLRRLFPGRDRSKNHQGKLPPHGE